MEHRALIPPSNLERETGLQVDTVRKWSSRYGWPKTASQNGLMGYTREQISQLKLIARLVASGFRPAQVVGKSLRDLDVMHTALCASVCETEWTEVTQYIISHLKKHEISEIEESLAHEMHKLGPARFAREIAAPLATGLGEAWSRSEIDIYQEHLCTSLLTSMLQTGIHQTRPQAKEVKVLITTPPGEQHTLGALMVQAVLSEAGIYSVFMGPDIPAFELPKAVQRCSPKVLALSFSFAYPQRKIESFLSNLRTNISADVEIWVGGGGVTSLKDKKEIDGIKFFSDLEFSNIQL